ncbi:hypothetical protein PACILC2_11950 [Paenibacillus cisolokensis]|uniref:Ribosomal RNA small subunit methyltransferase F N-terminal domain-containing protein n=1 Tax=Paenibacillus cisolokensis TaxID=1658519 RepID=A0ABQ4N376_9BACL|nr:hypothetical protein PACILC2_11950 [Paenibacillus cisolokensis]
MNDIRLPAGYIEQMRRMLGESEAERFFASYGEPRTYGLRLNPLKFGPRDTGLFAVLQEQFGLEPSPGARTATITASLHAPAPTLGMQPAYTISRSRRRCRRPSCWMPGPVK